MIDRSKRNTLKKIALGTGVMGAGVLGAGVVTSGTAFADQLKQQSEENLELGNIEITTRVSAVNNDLEIVMTNAGQQRINITHITPHTVRVPRGEFDISSLLKRGPLTLEAGQSATVPLKRLPLKIRPVQLTASTHSLTDTLKRSISVVTDNNAFASVTIPGAVGV